MNDDLNSLRFILYEYKSGVQMVDRHFEFLMYKSSRKEIYVDALIKDETIWLTQNVVVSKMEITT